MASNTSLASICMIQSCRNMTTSDPHKRSRHPLLKRQPALGRYASGTRTRSIIPAKNIRRPLRTTTVGKKNVRPKTQVHLPPTIGTPLLEDGPTRTPDLGHQLERIGRT